MPVASVLNFKCAEYLEQTVNNNNVIFGTWIATNIRSMVESFKLYTIRRLSRYAERTCVRKFIFVENERKCESKAWQNFLELQLVSVKSNNL